MRSFISANWAGAGPDPAESKRQEPKRGIITMENQGAYLPHQCGNETYITDCSQVVNGQSIRCQTELNHVLSCPTCQSIYLQRFGLDREILTVDNVL